MPPAKLISSSRNVSPLELILPSTVKPSTLWPAVPILTDLDTYKSPLALMSPLTSRIETLPPALCLLWPINKFPEIWLSAVIDESFNHWPYKVLPYTPVLALMSPFTFNVLSEGNVGNGDEYPNEALLAAIWPSELVWKFDKYVQKKI